MTRKQIPLSRQKQVVELYSRGDSMRSCANKIGVSLQAVHSIVHKYAPDTSRPQGRRPLDRARVNAMIALYRTGESMRRVAEKLGYTLETVHKILNRNSPEIIRRNQKN